MTAFDHPGIFGINELSVERVGRGLVIQLQSAFLWAIIELILAVAYGSDGLIWIAVIKKWIKF